MNDLFKDRMINSFRRLKKRKMMCQFFTLHSLLLRTLPVFPQFNQFTCVWGENL